MSKPYHFCRLGGSVLLHRMNTSKYRLRSAVGEARHYSYGRVAKQVNKAATSERK